MIAYQSFPNLFVIFEICFCKNLLKNMQFLFRMDFILSSIINSSLIKKSGKFFKKKDFLKIVSLLINSKHKFKMTQHFIMLYASILQHINLLNI